MIIFSLAQLWLFIKNIQYVQKVFWGNLDKNRLICSLHKPNSSENNAGKFKDRFVLYEKCCFISCVVNYRKTNPDCQLFKLDFF